MENFWQFTGLTVTLAGALFAVCYQRPFLGQKVVEFCLPMAQAGVLVLIGGSCASIMCKIAVGRLAAGMFAEDWAITDGTLDSDAAADGGRYIIGKIADSIDPVLFFNLWLLLAFGVALAALNGGLKLVLIARAEQIAGGKAGPGESPKPEGEK